MGNYLIPANANRGRLIFGLFLPIDLIIFGTGVVISFLLLTILPVEELLYALIAIFPGGLAALLCVPVAYYHNVRQLITEVYKYLFVYRSKYEWKGWCLYDYEGKSEQ